jgi:hypothetical protein
MSANLEKVFSPEVLAAFDERMRKIAQKTHSETASEWLDVPGAMTYTSSSEHHVRQFIRKLQAVGGDDVYQPNGPGTKPLLVRRSCLRDLTKISGKK